jgi:hypothetical protein
MRLTFEAPLETEAQLPDNLDETDIGRTWWIGYTWYMWAGHAWQKAIATRTAPGERR